MNTSNTNLEQGEANALWHFVNRSYELGLLNQYVSKQMCCQVVGPSGIGKSALLLRLTESQLQSGELRKVAYVNLKLDRNQTVEDFVKTVSSQWGGSISASSVAELGQHVDFLLKQGSRLVLCLDGFEEWTRKPEEFTADFFLDLRYVAQKGVSFVTASRVPLSNLLPSMNPVSPFFGLFAVLRLGPLSPSDSHDLLVLASGAMTALTPEDRDLMVRFSEGYPLRLKVAYEFVHRGKLMNEPIAVSLAKAETHLNKQSPDV